VSIAILAGLFEIVPFLGPIIAAIPPIVIGFGISPFMGVAAIALAFLIQQLENYVLVPKIMGKSAGVSPIVVLLALAIGFKLSGLAGMLVSIPLLIVFQETLKVYLANK
jgi:predicted PurR-regulated permease PerM